MAEFIRVGVRLRPFLASEVDEGVVPAVSIHGREVTLAGSTASHVFDHCFPACDDSQSTWASQEALFAGMGQSLVANAVNGYSVSLFAYGPTGSGKSYTIFGHTDSPGLVPRIVAQLFQGKHEIEATRTHEFRVWASFMEFYNEQITDLLWPDEDVPQDLKIMDHPKFGTCVPQLTEMACPTLEDVEQVLQFGTKRRLTAATQMNERSSRSHAIFTLRTQLLEGMLPSTITNNEHVVRSAGLPVVSDTDDPRQALCSKISLSDLAGSERQLKDGAAGVQFRDGSAINQSLAALALVVKELTDPVRQAAAHSRALQQAAFRSSKLTLFLKEALTGNSKTSMIATLSPRVQDLADTAATLRFAEEVAKIRTLAIQSRERKTDMLEQLRQEARRLHEASSDISRDGSYQLMLTHLIKIYGEYNVQLVEAQVLNQAWRASMSRNGLAHDGALVSPGVSEDTPHLLNMSKDPLLVGCLAYYIPEDGPITLGSADDCRIMLRGSGIAEQLCELTNKDNLELRIHKLTAAGRIVVNGRSLREGDVRSLHHGDKLYLGRAHVFRVVLPSRAREDPEEDVHNLSLHGLDGEWAALEESFAWRGLKDYLDQVLAQIPEDHAQRLIDELQRACMICDEANEITAECRPEEGFHFEVDLTSSVPSSIVICVAQADGPTPETDRSNYSMLYMWSLRQMTERLERMRDYHEMLLQTGSVVLDPLSDPWHEPHPAALARKICELETLVQVEREQNEQLRVKQQQSMDKTIMLLRSGEHEDLARSVFGAWAAAARSLLRAKEKGSASSFAAPTAAYQRRTKEMLKAPWISSSRDTGTVGKVASGSTPRAVFKAGIAPARPPPRTQFLPSRASTQQASQVPSVARGKRSTSVSRKQRSGAQKSAAGGAQAAPPDMHRVVRTASAPGPRSEDGDSTMFSAPPLSPDRDRTPMTVAKRGLVSPPREEPAPDGDRTESESEYANEVLPQSTSPSENEMLRRQLEAAWHLCNVLRSQKSEQEFEVPPPSSSNFSHAQPHFNDGQASGNNRQPASMRSCSPASAVHTPHDAERSYSGVVERVQSALGHATLRQAPQLQPQIVTRDDVLVAQEATWPSGPRAWPEGLRTRSQSPMATGQRPTIGGIAPSSPMRTQSVTTAMPASGAMQPIIYQQPAMMQVHTTSTPVRLSAADRLSATMPVVTAAGYHAAVAPATNVSSNTFAMRSWSRRGREGPHPDMSR